MSIAVIGRILARRSIRSSNGPDSREKYRRRSIGEHEQSTSRGGAHGQGFVVHSPLRQLLGHQSIKFKLII
jgi:hypothetical protein